jgi:hypothetical protein
MKPGELYQGTGLSPFSGCNILRSSSILIESVSLEISLLLGRFISLKVLLAVELTSPVKLWYRAEYLLVISPSYTFEKLFNVKSAACIEVLYQNEVLFVGSLSYVVGGLSTLARYFVKKLLPINQSTLLKPSPQLRK